MNSNDDLTTQSNEIIQQLYRERAIKQASPEWRYCFIYCLVILAMIIVMFINMFATINSFDGLAYTYDAKKVCVDQIKLYDTCMKNKATENNEECAIFNNLVQACFDEIDKYNQRCAIYITEYYNCIQKYKFNNTRQVVELCGGEINEINKCNTNPDLKVDPLLYINNP
jgi:hypothetical protein